MKKFGRVVMSVVAAILVLFSALHFSGKGRAAEEQPKEQPQAVKSATANEKPKRLPTVVTETVNSTAISKTLAITGTVTPTRTARIASPAEGPVETCKSRNCLVREGDQVKQDQILLRIGRNKTAEAQVTAARQALQEQELELQRLEKLVQAGAIPGAELDAARSKHENARAQFTKSVESNEDFLVAAPWSGVVAKVNVAEGDYVAPRAALIEIFDPQTLVVQFAVPEARSTEVREGMAVRVQLDAHPGKSFRGTISRVYPQLDAKLRTRTVEATLSDKVELIPGMFARIEVLLAEIADTVTVPVEAVSVTPKGEKVVFVLQDGKAHSQKVQTGVEDGGRVQLVAGIQPGAQVVVKGNENLKDGAEVKARSDAKP